MGAVGNSVYDESYEANADLSSNQFYAVTDTATNKVSLAGANTGRGILQNDPTSGQTATVRHLGLSKAVVDGSGTAIVYGDRLKSNASGILVKAATDNDEVLAHALGASTASGDIITVRMTGLHSLSI